MLKIKWYGFRHPIEDGPRTWILELSSRHHGEIYLYKYEFTEKDLKQPGYIKYVKMKMKREFEAKVEELEAIRRELEQTEGALPPRVPMYGLEWRNMVENGDISGLDPQGTNRENI